MPKTLIPPPPNDAAKAPIENVLELTSLKIIDKDLFTNTRPLWHPPGARGIYGGAAIAQSLAAEQLTIPAPSSANGQAKFYVHSMHCYFVLAGDADIPVIYSVERVREGRSFMTRTVQARQEGRCIFTTTVSFARAGSGGAQKVEHEAELPEGVLGGLEEILEAERRGGEGEVGDAERSGPFEHKRIALTNGESSVAEQFDGRTWRWEGEGIEWQSAYIRRDWGEEGILIPAATAAIGFGEWTLEDPVRQGRIFEGMTSGGMTEKLWKRDPVEVVDIVDGGRLDEDAGPSPVAARLDCCSAKALPCVITMLTTLQQVRNAPRPNAPTNGSRPAARSRRPPGKKRICPHSRTCPTAGSLGPSRESTTYGASPRHGRQRRTQQNKPHVR